MDLVHLSKISLDTKRVQDFGMRIISVLAVEVNPYRFIIVLDKKYIATANFNSLLTAMDGATWILTSFSIAALVSCYWVLHRALKPGWNEMIKIGRASCRERV